MYHKRSLVKNQIVERVVYSNTLSINWFSYCSKRDSNSYLHSLDKTMMITTAYMLDKTILMSTAYMDGHEWVPACIDMGCEQSVSRAVSCKPLAMA